MCVCVRMQVTGKARSKEGGSLADIVSANTWRAESLSSLFICQTIQPVFFTKL